MNRGLQWTVTLVVLLGLLVGCSLSCPPEEDMPIPAAQGTPDGEEPVATAAPTPTVAPTPDLRPAIIADVVNAVEADPWAEEAWQAAEEGMEVYKDGRVKAESESTALVDVDEGLVRVAPDTTFVYRRLDADTLELELDAGGQMWLNVDGLEEGGTVDIKAPAAVASVRGTVFSVRDDGGDIIVSTKVGTVTVASETGDEVDVGAGHQTTVVPGDPPVAPISMTPEEETRWGMAAGPDLQVVMPIVRVTDSVTITGYTHDPQISPGGDYLAVSYHIPSSAEGGPVLYGVGTGKFYSALLPKEAYYIRFNPVTGQIVFVLQDYPGQICLMTMEAPEPHCFRWHDVSSYSYPAWSPDGEWLAFSARSASLDAANLYKAPIDGSELIPLTDGAAGYHSLPSWSPNGEQIAYISYKDYDYPGEVWVMEADGTGARPVLTMTSHAYPPVWSPDGKWLAVPGYVDYEADEGGGLWIVPPDGTDPVLVPGTADWWCGSPAWSPTETGWPLFFYGYSEADKYGGLHWYVPNGDAGPVYFSYASWGPIWSADGTQVAFGHGAGSSPDVWTDAYFYETNYGLFTPLIEP